jgi:stage II sporulation protein D
MLAKRYWWGTALLWLWLVLPAQALEIRIAVRNGVDAVDIGSSTPGVIRDRNGQALYQLPQLQRITVDEERGQLELTDGQTDFAASTAFWLEPTDGGVVWIGDRWYRGRVLVVPTANGLTAINYVDVEQYLYSVVGSEMPASWPAQALQAQAVAARSYALYHLNRRSGQPYDMGGTQAWQVYRGLSGEATTTIAAVDTTAGQVLTYGGNVIEAVFHSSSGGHTENSEDVWSSAVPYLKGVQDFDHEAPVFNWQVAFSFADVSARVPGVGRIQTVQVLSRSGRGRVKQIRVVGEGGQRTLSGNEFRNALGLRSTKFNVAVNAAQQSVQIDGAGFGHGIGLSQWGARGMALQGYGYNQILSHYYQGTTLSTLDR